MFLIGEFSKLTQVTIRMLRYYDETGLLKPAQVDPQTGYRMYSIDQITTLNEIIYLRDSGFTVTEIANVLKSQDKALILEQLDKKQKEILHNIEIEKKKLMKIKLATKEIKHGESNIYNQITIKSIPSYSVLSIRQTIPNYYEEGTLWKSLLDYAIKHQIELSNNTFSIYYDDDFREENVEVELCVPVKQMGTSSGNFIFRHTEPVPLMASTMVYGDFSNIGTAYLSFAKWLQENIQYRMSSPSRQIVHRGPWNETDPKNYLVEIQIPLLER